jgi:hypothetical protein
MTTQLKGKLYYWYYVECADCEYEMPVGYHTRSMSMASLKRAGWKKTKRGYVCKECAEKATGQEAAR